MTSTYNCRALSIGGPFARLIAEGTKEIELRSWKTNYTGLVLLHASSSKDYDHNFELFDLDYALCPKFSIIGAAFLTGCISYTRETLWKRDLPRHLFATDDSYDYIRHEHYNSKPPIGHVFRDPVVFEPPIPDVPGAFNYWVPKNERQILGFEEAIAVLTSSQIDTLIPLKKS